MSQSIGKAADEPLVSIIVAFFNAERFLAETLDSVLYQTLQEWELILVDDGSSDNSASIANTFMALHPEKIRLLTHDHSANRGVCASRNLGIRHARGSFLAFLDADDVWEPDKLAQQTTLLQSYPDAGLVFGAPRYWNSWDALRSTSEKDFTPRLGIEANSLHEPPSLLYRCHPLGKASAPCPSDLLLRRDVVQSVHGFEESFVGKFQMYEDQAFLAKIYIHCCVYASSATWTRYRLHDQSCCSQVSSSGHENEVRLYYLEWLERYLKTQGVTEQKVLGALDRALRLKPSSWQRWTRHATDGFKAVYRRYRWW